MNRQSPSRSPTSSSSNSNQRRRQWAKLLAPVPALVVGAFFTATVAFWTSLSLEHPRGLLQPHFPHEPPAAVTTPNNNNRNALENDVNGPLRLATSAVKTTPTSTDDPTVLGTAACLCVMDDNHFLTEWLAFHYHTVNLTHLIITIDPDSLTRPTHVLDRWRDRMTIEEWQDEDFLPDDWPERVKRKTLDNNKAESLVGHRFRQAHFNLACLEALKKANRGWTLMIDTDEYLFPNPEVSDRGEKINRETGHYPYPPMEKPGSTLEVLNRLLIPHPQFEELDRPCIPVFRHQFSARESTVEQVNDLVPPGFDGMAFQTLRWRKFGYNEIHYRTQWGKKCHLRRWVPNKVLVDLGRLRLPDLVDNPENSGNPHTPLDLCPDNVYVARKQTPMVTHHYMGTIDQWLYRQGDKRGIGYRLARYEDLNEKIGTEETDQARPWLKGFVESVGQEEALRLLRGVGELDPLPGGTPPIYDPRLNETHEVFELGEVIQADYQGDGEWGWVEVNAVHKLAKGFYNVLYADDCSEEIATFADRLRRKDNTTGGLDHIPYFQKLMAYHEATKDDDEEDDRTEVAR